MSCLSASEILGKGKKSNAGNQAENQKKLFY